MKVIQTCVAWNTNHREDDEDNVDIVIFLLRFTWLPSNYVLVVSIAHLVRWLIGITRQARTSGTTGTYPKSEDTSMTRSTRVTRRDPHGVIKISLKNPPSKHCTIFSCACHASRSIQNRT
jgi:hypothetical protein